MMQRPRLSSSSGVSEEEDDGSRRVTKGLWAGPIYKGRLINGREKQGGQDAIISPQKRLDFRDGSKGKIRCGSGGIKKWT